MLEHPTEPDREATGGTEPSPAVVWPFQGLSASSGDLELRYLDDDLLFAVAAVAGRGVHAQDQMPFDVPWTRGTPEQVARSVLAYEWGKRAALAPDDWSIELGVLLDGVPVGIQAIGAANFPVVRTVETGSWLGRDHQGHGLGTRMRALMLHLAFAGLGADFATTSAWADNGPSNGVTRKLGYAPNGVARSSREGRPAEKLFYRLARADWERSDTARLPDVTLTGTAPVREFLRIT